MSDNETSKFAFNFFLIFDILFFTNILRYRCINNYSVYFNSCQLLSKLFSKVFSRINSNRREREYFSTIITCFDIGRLGELVAFTHDTNVNMMYIRNVCHNVKISSNLQGDC